MTQRRRCLPVLALQTPYSGDDQIPDPRSLIPAPCFSLSRLPFWPIEPVAANPYIFDETTEALTVDY